MDLFDSIASYSKYNLVDPILKPFRAEILHD